MGVELHLWRLKPEEIEASLGSEAVWPGVA